MAVKQATIIGAGPCGMASAKALVEEGLSVTVLESKAQFGGVWLYNGKGPMYRDLDTNLPHDLMMFKDHPFPQLLPNFPDRKDVFDYVDEYSKEIKATIKFNTKVVSVTKEGDKWCLADENNQEYLSDFLVVAAGHCEFPYYPPLRGFNLKDPRITHSRYFNEPSIYKDKRVLIVGNASSAIDLAIHILGVTTEVAISRRHEGPLDHILEDFIEFHPEILYLAESEVYFNNGASDIPDVILFCTGYTYDFPFLNEYNNTLKVPVLSELRSRICNLYRNTFYLDDSTLAFVAMDKNIVPMPYSECQAAAIARVYNGRLVLPSKKEMLKLEADKVLRKGEGSGFHSMKTPEDIEFMLSMNDWVDTAGSPGFFAERWGESKINERKNVAAIKGKEIERRLSEVRKKWN